MILHNIIRLFFFFLFQWPSFSSCETTDADLFLLHSLEHAAGHSPIVRDLMAASLLHLWAIGPVFNA